MVRAGALKEIELPLVIETTELPEEELKWCTVRLQEVLAKGNRLEASVFNIEGKHAREVLKQCKWPLTVFAGEKGLSECYHRGRFKRIWVEKSDLPIFQPSQIEEIKPKPTGFLSSLTRTDIDALRVRKGQILLTCSGTIGNCSFVGKTLDKQIFSHDLIRISAKKETDAGFLYAFLRTKISNALVRTNQYGAVVKHIEPEHLEDIPIPNPPDILKKKIHDLIIKSYDLRDESNVLLDKAEALLYEALDLPPLDKLRPRYFNAGVGLRNYSVKLSKLDGRFDGSYHVPIVESIIKQLNKEAAEVTTVGDPRISVRVILPGRFARVYVEEGQGTVFFGGKQLLELDPANKKYLSLIHHGERIKKELRLEKNMVMITVSGTVGKAALAPEHWEGWAANQHIIRIVPSSLNIAGYLYVFLATDYGHELITRFTYGAVVDEIDASQVSQIAVPILKDASTQKEINHLALEANSKRAEAYRLEQEAIKIINEEVIRAENKEVAI
ncbi:MAG: restriction endonuclease subunit S [Deltaproteobacteria bacterium]|nr:restriction endonuclease subunit S [Deltaproteobacteria bacterium]